MYFWSVQIRTFGTDVKDKILQEIGKSFKVLSWPKYQLLSIVNAVLFRSDQDFAIIAPDFLFHKSNPCLLYNFVEIIFNIEYDYEHIGFEIQLDYMQFLLLLLLHVTRKMNRYFPLLVFWMDQRKIAIIAPAFPQMQLLFFLLVDWRGFNCTAESIAEKTKWRKVSFCWLKHAK